MEGVDQFIEQMLIDKGLGDLDADVKEDLKEEMKTKLLEEIDKEALRRLPEDKAEELEAKLDDPEWTNEKMAEFMQEAGVDLTQAAVDAMLRFRDFYLGVEE